MFIVLPSSECPLGNQCDSTNGRCILVNSIQVCTCILGYELQSDKTTCSGKKSHDVLLKNEVFLPLSAYNLQISMSVN